MYPAWLQLPMYSESIYQTCIQTSLGRLFDYSDGNKTIESYNVRHLSSSKSVKRKWSIRMLFGRSRPSYTPYHMMVESRPLYLLLRLIRTPLRLQRRYQAHPLLTGTSNVVYICMPIANYTVASCLNDLDQLTHHTI